MSKKGYEMGSRNLFKDLGVPNAEEHMIKAQLVFKIDPIMNECSPKQVEAAALLGIRQPDVSMMLRGEFRQFSGSVLSPRGATKGRRRGGSCFREKGSHTHLPTAPLGGDPTLTKGPRPTRTAIASGA